MKKIILIIIIFALSFSKLYSSCAEKSYHLYPIGELNGKLILIEFDFFRYCMGSNGAGFSDDNEFWVSGIVKLVTFEEDTLSTLKFIDSLKFEECNCTYRNYNDKSNFQTIIEEFYLKAIDTALSFNNFLLAETKTVVFDDNINCKLVETDTSYQLIYKNLLDINLFNLNIISCLPSNIAEIRTYETKSFNVTIVRIACNLLP